MIFSITLPEHEAPRTASQSYTFTASDCMETSDVCWRSVYHSVSDQELTLIGQISKSAVWKSRLKTLWCLQWKQRTPGGDVRDSFSHICKWTTDNNLINDNNYHLQPNNSFVFNAAKFFSLFFFFTSLDELHSQTRHVAVKEENTTSLQPRTVSPCNPERRQLFLSASSNLQLIVGAV